MIVFQVEWSLFVLVLLGFVGMICCSEISPVFKIGNFCSTIDSSFINIRNVLDKCLDIALDKQQIAFSACQFEVGLNKSLRDLNRVKFATERTAVISNQLSACYQYLMQTQNVSQEHSEILFQAALVLNPLNAIATKNYAHILEIQSCYDLGDRLLAQSMDLISSDAGIRVQYIFGACSLDCANNQKRIFRRVVVRALLALRQAYNGLLAVNEYIHPYNDIRALQTNYQYLGFSPGIIAELYCRVLIALYPTISSLNLQFIKGETETFPVESKSFDIASRLEGNQLRRIRVGIVASQFLNSSPGLCVADIFSLWIKEHGDEIELVTFDRPGSPLIFSEIMKNIGRLVELDESNIDLSMALIAQEDVDILIYLAIPTEKFTTLLSVVRLAPIQIQYGIGHPLTSGSPVIDYSIVSTSMMATTERWYRTAPVIDSVDRCIESLNRRDFGSINLTESSLDELIYSSEGHTGNIMHVTALNHCAFGTDDLSRPHYSEQLVMFDSLGYYLDDSLSYLLPDEKFDPEVFSAESSCSVLQEWIAIWRLSAQLTANELGCGGQVRTTRLYANLQIPRKIHHPQFEQALVGILKSDRSAKILMFMNTKPIVNRWAQIYNLSTEELDARILFVSRLPHHSYLRLLSISSVFLNPFPFGAGITSSDALSVCTPVVVFPRLTSVLHMALAQVLMLGQEILSEMVVDSVDEYIQQAIRLAQNDHQMKHSVCNAKTKLFSRTELQRAVQEWNTFITSI